MAWQGRLGEIPPSWWSLRWTPLHQRPAPMPSVCFWTIFVVPETGSAGGQLPGHHQHLLPLQDLLRVSEWSSQIHDRQMQAGGTAASPSAGPAAGASRSADRPLEVPSFGPAALLDQPPAVLLDQRVLIAADGGDMDVDVGVHHDHPGRGVARMCVIQDLDQ